MDAYNGALFHRVFCVCTNTLACFPPLRTKLCSRITNRTNLCSRTYFTSDLVMHQIKNLRSVEENTSFSNSLTPTPVAWVKQREIYDI